MKYAMKLIMDTPSVSGNKIEPIIVKNEYQMDDSLDDY